MADRRPDVQALVGRPLPDSYARADAEVARVTEGQASALSGINASAGMTWSF